MAKTKGKPGGITLWGQGDAPRPRNRLRKRFDLARWKTALGAGISCSASVRQRICSGFYSYFILFFFFGPPPITEGKIAPLNLHASEVTGQRQADPIVHERAVIASITPHYQRN